MGLFVCALYCIDQQHTYTVTSVEPSYIHKQFQNIYNQNEEYPRAKYDEPIVRNITTAQSSQSYFILLLLRSSAFGIVWFQLHNGRPCNLIYQVMPRPAPSPQPQEETVSKV
jgi:hypothetical protein